MAEKLAGNEEVAVRAAINDPAYWRDRARSARRDARAMADPDVKAMMHEVAAIYTRLARWTGRHAAPLGWIERLRYGRGVNGDGQSRRES